MTLHVAAMYFDSGKGDCGFLLGADRYSGNKEKTANMLEDVVLVEKAFRSPNTIGLCSGEFHWPKGKHEELIRSFDDTFDDIHEQSDYSRHPTLLKANSATLSIVKRTEKSLALYCVYTRKDEEHVEVRVRKHRELRRGPYVTLANTPFWQDLTVHGIPKVLYDHGRKGVEEMHRHLLWILKKEAKYHSDRIGGPFDFYAIDFDGIRKIA